MKSVFYISIFWICSLLCSSYAWSQPANNNPQTLEFIDGIEIIRSQALKLISTSTPSTKTKSSTPLTIESFQSIQFKYGQLFNVEIEQIENLSLYQFIEEWLDTKYRMGGKSKSGIDCSGFAGVLYETNYHQLLPRTAREQHHTSEKVEMADLKEGDLVFFNTRGGVSHVGVYLHNRFFVHASTKEGVMISNLDEPYYKKTFISAGRLPTQ